MNEELFPGQLTPTEAMDQRLQRRRHAEQSIPAAPPASDPQPPAGSTVAESRAPGSDPAHRGIDDGEPLLVATGVTRIFPTPAGERVANNHIDLAVRPAELLVIAGPSGAGKTTLLNLLAGLDRPTSGQVTLAGRDFASLNDSELAELRREYIGYVFQTFGLLPMLSARENVEVPLRLLRTAAAERDARVTEVLSEVGLTGHGDQRPAELSGGQQQRVSIARALVARPRLLLADEPTGQLDSATAGTIIELIKHLVHRLGVAAVVTTHDETLMGLADRVLLLHDGTVSSATRTGVHELSDAITGPLPVVGADRGGRHAR